MFESIKRFFANLRGKLHDAQDKLEQEKIAKETEVLTSANEVTPEPVKHVEIVDVVNTPVTVQPDPVQVSKSPVVKSTPKKATGKTQNKSTIKNNAPAAKTPTPVKSNTPKSTSKKPKTKK